MKLGPPAEGEVVEVKWPDGKLYGAKYLGLNVAHMYQVSAEQCLTLAEMDRRSQRIYPLCCGSANHINMGYLLFCKGGKHLISDDPGISFITTFATGKP